MESRAKSKFGNNELIKKAKNYAFVHTFRGQGSKKSKLVEIFLR